MTELKPCPACGSKIATPVLEYDVKFPQLGYVRCREITCGLKTGLFADGGRHAVEIWNSIPRTDEVRGAGKWLRKEKVRHNLDGDGDYRYECSACGHSDEHNENVHVPFCWYCGAKMEVEGDA